MRSNTQISRSDMERIIDDLCMKPKYREILKLRYLDWLTFEEIAERVDMSDRRGSNYGIPVLHFRS